MDFGGNPSKMKVAVTMKHIDKKVKPTVSKQCKLQSTGRADVSRIITGLVCLGHPLPPQLWTLD